MPRHSPDWDAGYRAGIEAAAQWLIGTAQDYKQMAQVNMSVKLTPNERAALGVMQEKAQLLEGQAGHIRNLKP